MDRRVFLRMAGGIASLTLLAACTGVAPGAPTATGTSGGAKAALRLPAQISLKDLPKPDLPSSTDGVVSPGYLSYPPNLIKSVAQPPGKGSDVTAFTVSLSPAPTAVDQNPAWQQVNKELGVNLKTPIVSTVDFPTRLATAVAGADIPDLVTVAIFANAVQNIADFLQAACADLTPYLSGDAIKDFPNLANLPAYAWPPTVYNNKIFTVPIAAGGLRGAGQAMMARWQVLDQAGIMKISSADEFEGILKQVTIPGTRWGIGAQGLLPWLVQVYGGPNVWREQGGTFTKDYETDEFKAAVTYHRRLWDDGVFHPDSASLSGSPAGAQYYAGKFVFAPYFSWSSYQTVWDRTLNADPGFKPRAVVPFKYDGSGQAAQFLGNGVTGIVAIKKAPEARVRELLGILDYLAAPIGTQEQLLLTYGAQNVDFKFDDKGTPVPTQQALSDLAVPWKNVCSPPDFLYSATSAEYVPVTHQSQTEIFKVNLPNPTVGLYSPTDGSKGIGLRTAFTDGVNQILFGREPVSALDQLVKDWRTNGGDQIRKEYAQARQLSS